MGNGRADGRTNGGGLAGADRGARARTEAAAAGEGVGGGRRHTGGRAMHASAREPVRSSAPASARAPALPPRLRARVLEVGTSLASPSPSSVGSANGAPPPARGAAPRCAGSAARSRPGPAPDWERVSACPLSRPAPVLSCVATVVLVAFVAAVVGSAEPLTSCGGERWGAGRQSERRMTRAVAVCVRGGRVGASM